MSMPCWPTPAPWPWAARSPTGDADMRLLTLDLERFGPFTDKRLAFRPDARLHVVHGRNEAGKSCSLAGVTDLLFGIERTTRFDWLHPGKELRLGATLRNRDGRGVPVPTAQEQAGALECVRRGAAGRCARPFLGGLTREVFRRAFGLDAEALRKSAEDLRHTDGELGAALFSAASGLRGVSDAKAALEEEADAIFAERKAKDRPFYQALARFEDARKLLREHRDPRRRPEGPARAGHRPRAQAPRHPRTHAPPSPASRPAWPA